MKTIGYAKYINKYKLLIFMIVLLFAVVLMHDSVRADDNAGRTESVINVGPDGDCATIREAVERAGEGSTIRIKNGVYTENLKVNKNVTLVGETRNGVILEYPCTRYSKPPLEAQCGTFKNMTIRAGIDEEEYNGTHSYAVHCEKSYRGSGSEITFENCVFESIGNWDVGIGSRDGFTANFIKCRFNNLGLYYHTYGKNTGMSSTSNLNMLDCEFAPRSLVTIRNCYADTSILNINADGTRFPMLGNLNVFGSADAEGGPVLDESFKFMAKNVYWNGKKALSEIERVDFDEDEAYSYCENPVCNYDGLSDSLRFDFRFSKGIPKSDDRNVYLFELSSFENDFTGKVPVCTAKMKVNNSLFVPFVQRHIFSGFVPAIRYGGRYVALSDRKYIHNPEVLASNQSDYPDIESIKGILPDGSMIGTEAFANLKAKRMVYNMPLSLIVGETDDEEQPTIEYEYNGEKYHFNGYYVMIYDALFATLTNLGYYCDVIILNDWNDKHPEMVHRKSRNRTPQSLYYAFNTEDEKSVRLLEATAMFLAQRYSSGKYGMVYDWIIANEINQQKIWNYMDTEDIGEYTECFEKSFRIFYNAVKMHYSNANVYFSIDHDWNNNNGDNSSRFNGRDILYTFNDIAKSGGNYDWGVAIHPYPDPLTKVKFWEGKFDKTENARVLTPMNLSTITSLLEKEDFRDTDGNVRNLAVTELGFSSQTGEKMQAAAFAYCYYILEDNPYIKSFLMNRMTDSEEEMLFGLALGIYKLDHKAKYIEKVFSNVDSKEGEAYIPEMLKIIGADSLEEALEWAR